MNILIDTHALIWFLDGDPKLSAKADAAMRNQQFRRFVSKATLWEIAIKTNLGRLQTVCPLADIPNSMLANNFELLAISFDHILSVSTLTLHHGDPFDRMLIAQALAENLTVVTKDPEFPPYGVATIW